MMTTVLELLAHDKSQTFLDPTPYKCNCILLFYWALSTTELLHCWTNMVVWVAGIVASPQWLQLKQLQGTTRSYTRTTCILKTVQLG
jgi:hypothetical protein